MNASQVKKIANAYLDTKQQPTMSDIQDIAIIIKSSLKLEEPLLDIVNIITSDINIYQPASAILTDDEDGANWLTIFRAEGNCEWRFWKDYKKYLTLPSSALTELDNSTEKILDRLVNPNKEGNWFRSGLVVGHVQSGKTSNFIGLINKAMDVGYKIILILTGMYSDLRMQTQKRVDKGSIGKVTDPDSIHSGDKIGVGKYKGHPNIINMTSSNMKGDFGSLMVNIGGVLTSSSPTILVCKKNSSILTNIIKKFAQEASKMADDGYPIVDNIPLLVIDDEADSASINTQYNKSEITQINAKIRTILSLFSKRAYIGYTATPYANIFIDPDQVKLSQTYTELEGKKYRLCKDDLFPKNFIVNLSAPDNYIGPNVLYGISSIYEESDESDESEKGLKIFEYIEDGFPSRKKNHRPTRKEDLPDSLIQAIKYYFLSAAIRRARGQKSDHCSMLINVSQYIDWQDAIASFVQEVVQDYCDMLGAINDNPRFVDEIKDLYINKFIPSNKDICEKHNNWKPLLNVPRWTTVKQELPVVAAKVRKEVRVIHSGKEEDENLNTKKLNYEEYENCVNEIDNGLYTIVIGGNTMSRGITLEGLTVSYFFRTTHTFDALMQMGRWFGYRDGYIDTCRLYMEKDMSVNFKNIAVATQEMRDDFDEMFAKNTKPSEFGLKVKSFPGVLEVTSRNKFGSAVVGELSLNKTTLQAYQIDKSIDIIEKNYNVVLRFLNELGTPSQKARHKKVMPHLFWECKSDRIISFINDFKTSTVRMPSNLVTSYIESQNKIGNITDWTVALINVKQGKPIQKEIPINGTCYKIGLSRRVDEAPKDFLIYSVSNAALMGLAHESIDLSNTEFDNALNLSKSDWRKAFDSKQTKAKEPNYPYPPRAKQNRQSNKALLLLFYIDFADGVDKIFSYAISMPEIAKESDTTITYKYVGQPIAFNKSLNPNEMFQEMNAEYEQ